MVKSNISIKKFFLLLLIIFIIFGLSPTTKNSPQISYENLISPTISISKVMNKENARVSYVLDGDSIVLTDGRKLRYIGLDAAEKNKCFSQEATNINKQLVAGEEIEMAKDISDTDKYGRLLRFVYVNDVFINDFLLRQGYAQVDIVPPDVKYTQKFLEAEREARIEKRGLWKSCVK